MSCPIEVADKITLLVPNYSNLGFGRIITQSESEKVMMRHNKSEFGISGIDVEDWNICYIVICNITSMFNTIMFWNSLEFWSVNIWLVYCRLATISQRISIDKFRCWTTACKKKSNIHLYFFIYSTSTNQPTNQSTNLPTNQPTNQATSQPTNQPTDQPTN